MTMFVPQVTEVDEETLLSVACALRGDKSAEWGTFGTVV